MNKGKKITAFVGAFALILCMGGVALAQESSDDTRITIWVDNTVTGVLSVNVLAGSFSDVAPGGTSTGTLTIIATDGRVGTGLEWYVEASIGSFEGDFEFQQFDAELDWQNPARFPDTLTGDAGGVIPVDPAAAVVFHDTASQGGGVAYLASGPATASIPMTDNLDQPLVADYYSATITVSIYSEDPGI